MADSSKTLGVQFSEPYRLYGLKGPMESMCILSQDGQMGILVQGEKVFNALAEGKVDLVFGDIRSREFEAAGAIAIRGDWKGAVSFNSAEIALLKKQLDADWVLERRGQASWIGVPLVQRHWQFADLFHIVAPDLELRETDRQREDCPFFRWWEVKKSGAPWRWEPDMSATLITLEGGRSALGDQLKIDDGMGLVSPTVVDPFAELAKTDPYMAAVAMLAKTDPQQAMFLMFARK